ncbi:unnamed protein product [Agarophyton chilense]
MMFLSRLLDALYILVYISLWFFYRLSKLASDVDRRIQYQYVSRNQRGLDTDTSEARTPNHVALSGAISEEIQALWVNVRTLILRGTRHVTLHDPYHKIDMRQVERLVKESDFGMVCKVTQIDSKHTTHSVIRSDSVSTAEKHEDMEKSIQIREFDEETRPGLEVALTIVEGQSGTSLITRAARTLAHSPDIETHQLNPETVTEWLDSNACRCMLPSEPDVVMVFPKAFSRWAPTLEGFPVWQLRLSQIVFVRKPITSVDFKDLLRLVTKASNAPKRFGR